MIGEMYDLWDVCCFGSSILAYDRDILLDFSLTYVHTATLPVIFFWFTFCKCHIQIMRPISKDKILFL